MKIRTLPLALMASMLFVACDDSTGVDVTMSSVAGTYTASAAKSGSKLDVTENGTTTNYLSLGSVTTLTLTASGNVSGHVFIPVVDGDPETGLDTNLTGTWTLDDDEVEIHTNEDTFLEDFEFDANNSRLVGTAVQGSTTISFTLVK